MYLSSSLDDCSWTSLRNWKLFLSKIELIIFHPKLLLILSFPSSGIHPLCWSQKTGVRWVSSSTLNLQSDPALGWLSGVSPEWSHFSPAFWSPSCLFCIPPNQPFAFRGDWPLHLCTPAREMSRKCSPVHVPSCLKPFKDFLSSLGQLPKLWAQAASPYLIWSARPCFPLQTSHFFSWHILIFVVRHNAHLKVTFSCLCT